MKLEKILIWMLLTSPLFLLNSCLNELDNYPAPNGEVFGNIVDSETGEVVPLSVPGSNGTIIELKEQGTNAVKAQRFYAHADGSFDNKLVFNGSYQISIQGGAFVKSEKVQKNIKGKTKVTIPVTPYTRVEASAKLSEGKLNITYKIQKTNDSFHVNKVIGYWNISPNVDNSNANYLGKSEADSLEGSIEIDLNNNSEFDDNLYKIEDNDGKIFFRVGVEVNGKVNYSAINFVTLP